MTATVHDHVVARIDGRPLLLSAVEARLAELRTGRLAAVLPSAATAEGRNMRRWVVQLCAAEQIVRTECGGGTEPAGGGPLSVTAALQVGGVAAAILKRVPGALDLIPPVAPDEEDVRGYYDRNRDLYPQEFGAVRASIAAELAEHRRITEFARWLERELRARLRLQPGFEHPAEPGHPDSTHRH